MGSRSGPAMLALLGVIALPLGAQETSYLLGRVIDAGTKAPLNGAFVSFPDTRRGVFTDPDGVFRLPGAVPNDARKVQIELIGYGIAELPARLLSPPSQRFHHGRADLRRSLVAYVAGHERPGVSRAPDLHPRGALLGRPGCVRIAPERSGKLRTGAGESSACDAVHRRGAIVGWALPARLDPAPGAQHGRGVRWGTHGPRLHPGVHGAGVPEALQAPPHRVRLLTGRL